MRTALILLFAAILSGQAQTNPPATTTNWVTAAPNFREVDGKLYNIEKSKVWEQLHFEAMLTDSNGTFGWKKKPFGHMHNNSSSGNYIGIGAYGSPGYFVIDGYENDCKVLLRNSPALADRQEITVPALKVGTTTIDSRTVEVWDCGKPHQVAVIKTNKPIVMIGQ